LIIIGDIDDEKGGLGFVRAGLMSRPYNITVPISFYIDTGCSNTTVCQNDASKARIFDILLKSSPRLIYTANGPISAYVLPNCEIVFLGTEGPILEYIGNINVLGLQSSNPISLLGLDVLKRFSIHFDIENNHVVLQR
jgi:predicted aspartyl protease